MRLSRALLENFILKYPRIISAILISPVILIICNGEYYSNIFLLPLFYAITELLFNRKIEKRSSYVGGFIYQVALIAIYIRYVITPLSIGITGSFYAYYGGTIVNTSSSNIQLAIFLMILELISVYITLYFARLYYSSKNNNCILNETQTIKNKVVLVSFLLLTIPIIIIIEPNLIIPSDLFLLSEDFSKEQLDMAYSGALNILSQMVRPTIFLVFMSEIKKKYNKTNKKIYTLLSFLLMVLFIGMYTGTTRWELVFAGIIGIYLFKSLYAKVPKTLLLATIVLITIAFFSASLYKFSWATKSSLNPIKDITFEMFGMMQDYFSGPRSVANSIEMKNAYTNQIGVTTFFNDFLGSIPILSRYIEQSNRINAYFNIFHYRPIGHTTLIIPMLGVGYSYFKIFPPIFSIVCYWLVIKFDYGLKKSKTLEYKYLYLYPGLYLAMAMGFNTQIIFTTILLRFLPLYILFKLNSLICLRK